MEKIVEDGEAGKINRLTLHDAVMAGIKTIALTHPEVHDTEPDSQIPHEINKRLCEPQLWGCSEYEVDSGRCVLLTKGELPPASRLPIRLSRERDQTLDRRRVSQEYGRWTD